MFPYHHRHSIKSDKWTKFAAVGEGVSSFISDAYWLGGLFDVITGLSATVVGLSTYAIVFGSISALLSSIGAAYSHQVLNTIHQQNQSEDASSPPAVNVSEITPLHPNSSSLSSAQKFILFGAFVSHIGDIAGPFSFVVNLAAKDNLPRWANALTQCCSTIIGGFSAVANVRTSRDAMLQANSAQINSMS